MVGYGISNGSMNGSKQTKIEAHRMASSSRGRTTAIPLCISLEIKSVEVQVTFELKKETSVCAQKDRQM